MSAAHDPCAEAVLAAVAACQPVRMRVLLRGLKPRGFSAGAVRHATGRLVAHGHLRVLSAGRPFVYALAEAGQGAAAPTPPLRTGPAELPLTRRLLWTLQQAGEGGCTAAALIDLYAVEGNSSDAVRCALAELQRHAVPCIARRGRRGHYVYRALPPGQPRLRLCAGRAVRPLQDNPTLAPSWPAPTCPQRGATLAPAPLTGRIAA